MNNDGAVRTWSSLRGLAVMTPTRGYTFGTVENFYFKAGTNAIDSLQINRGLFGYRALPVTAILAIEKDAVIVLNDQAFLSALPALPTAKELLSYKVAGESGTTVGTVSEILLALHPIVAARIVGFDFVAGNHKYKRHFSASDVLHYRENTIIIDDQDAKRLH